MKRIKIILLFTIFSSGILFARPWEKFLNTESISVDIKPLQYFELSNKIRVYYIKNNVLPKATFQLVVDGGQAEESETNSGLTAMWGKTVVFSGSKEFPRKKLSETLELHGTEFNFDSAFERSFFSFDSLSDYYESDLAMVMDVLKNPAFSKPDLDLIKSQYLQGIKKRTENPAQMANIAAQLIQWKNNARGNISTSKTIEPIDDIQLKAWHKKMMTADRFTILITGNIDPDHMKTILESYFKEFHLSNVVYNPAYLNVPSDSLKKGSEVIYHQIKDIPQTTILYRAHGIKHNDNDYYALKLYDFLLGGDSFNSYLTKVIRVQNGWAYGVYSNYSSGAYTGNLNIFVQTQNKNVSKVLDEIDKILKNPDAIIDEKRLSAAKNSITNSLVFMAETPEALARLQLSLKWDNLPDDYLPHYLENIQKVTTDDLRRVAKKYYSPDNYFISIVGPKDIISSEKALKDSPARIKVMYTLPE
ncbi:MAG: insulinase family protein [Spirochaetia bacterium]|nr:insulinase family protein [Spirochaetia bacterium]